MQIRDAVKNDLKEIVAIYNSTISSRMVTADTEPVTIESRLKWFDEHSPDKRPLWVAESNGQVVGWLGFQSFRGRPAYHKTSEISIYVSEAFRQKNIGRLLLNRAIENAPSLGLKTLLALVFAHNKPSLGLFKSCGFEEWGYLPHIAEMDEKDYDLIICGLKV